MTRNELIGVRKQLLVEVLEVARTEGLEGMADQHVIGKSIVRVLTSRASSGAGLSLVHGRERLEQLRHDHRRWAECIVPNALPNESHDEALTSRAQRLQKKVTVVTSAIRVPGSSSVLPVLQQVEVRPERLAGERTVVHTHDADHFEGDVAHRYHGAYGDAAGQKASRRSPLLEPLIEQSEYHSEPQWLVVVCRRSLLSKRFQRIEHLLILPM